ncbi:hypothetical protein BDZ97DRAFT_1929732 [Flammula alnicola]|nr:hypothetical protein BDZ97DRAFT_1929732 [Flammula alnicola]
MSAAICAYLQPVWNTLRHKFLLFALTPEMCYISAASMALSQLGIQMDNYMQGLKVTRSPEPVTYFNPSRIADFYPLYIEMVSDAEMDNKLPLPNYVGLGQRLLEAIWVYSPIVGPLVAYSPLPLPVLVSPALVLEKMHLLLPPSAPALPEMSLGKTR